MKFKIIPYEDREKYCTGFNPLGQNQSDEELKAEIIRKASAYLDFGGIKKSIKILDKIDIQKLRDKEITIQVEDFYFVV